MHDSSNLPDLFHQGCKVIGEDRLHAIGERLVRIAMDLDDDSIRTHSNCSSGERSDLVALASSVARIDDDRQMTQTLYSRNDAQIERIASVIGEGAHATFT